MRGVCAGGLRCRALNHFALDDSNATAQFAWSLILKLNFCQYFKIRVIYCIYHLDWKITLLRAAQICCRRMCGNSNPATLTQHRAQ